MMVYDLRCTGGHVFEAWFKDRRSFLQQKEEGLVECPSCRSRQVDIAFTACAIRTDSAKELPKAHDSFSQRLAVFLEKNFEDVGGQFAEEARRMHRGETKNRSIRGFTTPDEEESLRSEGIDFIKMPLPKLDA